MTVVYAFVALVAQVGVAGEMVDIPVCVGHAQLEHSDSVRGCVAEVLEAATEGQAKVLRKALGTLEETRAACGSTLEKGTGWGCVALSDLTYDLFTQAATLLQACQADPTHECENQGRAAALAVINVWRATEGRHQNTPAEAMVTNRLIILREELGPLADDTRIGEGDEALPPAWHVAVRAVDRIKHWVTGYIWRETHWLWLQDSLLAGRVVQTAWGDADEWLRFGVHDAHADAPLSRSGPRYLFDNRLGMRWEIMVGLLRELHDRRGATEELVVVEIGVFSGTLSNVLLRDCNFIRLLGVDPYIGRDGTFPGNFSRTLDADVALYKAASVMEPYSDRAQLWPMTSEEASSQIQDGSIDAIFIDGCHLYDCVRRDLELWLPKMRSDVETLVSGHDFSPQWPGVVQAVHEQRAGGLEVNLASDWMFWWFNGAGHDR